MVCHPLTATIYSLKNRWLLQSGQTIPTTVTLHKLHFIPEFPPHGKEFSLQRSPMNPIRLQSISLSLLCAFSQTLTFAADKTSANKPDVVIIVADDLGWGDLGCYGSSEVLSPSLDKLAERGQRWTNFYANCCVCSPTRASILTGCYPDRVGVPGVIRTHPHNSWGNLIDKETLPQVLSEANYQTACVGKWHLGLSEEDHPLNRGFDHFHGFLGDMMDDYFHHRRHSNNYMRLGHTEINPAGHATSIFTGWAQSLITQMSQNDNPYFLYLAYNAPHTPIQPPAAALAKVKKRLPEVSEKRAKLIALIEDMDAAIGRVLDTIQQTERDTLIVFVSDNGGQLSVGADNGNLRDGKQSNYEGGLRVPAIFCRPNVIQPSIQENALGVTMDLVPTICDLVGVTPPEDIDGLSLKSWIADPDSKQPEREIYFVRREGGTKYAGLTIEALRKGDWKLVHNLPTQEFELYNLKKDPVEKVNLAGKEGQKFRSMMSSLMLHIQAAGQVPWQ